MKIFCLEDNALVVMHLEDIIESSGHEFAGSAASFSEAKALWQTLDFDLGLIDIDLTDGKTGIDAARWLKERRVPACFVTGQFDLANQHRDLVCSILDKPLDEPAIERAFAEIAREFRPAAS